MTAGAGVRQLDRGGLQAIDRNIAAEGPLGRVTAEFGSICGGEGAASVAEGMR